MALHVVSCKVQLPIKNVGHSPHTSGSLSPNNFGGIIIGVSRIITSGSGLRNGTMAIGVRRRIRIRIRMSYAVALHLVPK